MCMILAFLSSGVVLLKIQLMKVCTNTIVSLGIKIVNLPMES